MLSSVCLAFLSDMLFAELFGTCLKEQIEHVKKTFLMPPPKTLEMGNKP